MILLKGIKRVTVGMSGGVDSAIAALFLKRKGYETVGAFMRNWDLRDEMGYCSAEDDIRDAESICKELDLKFHVVNFVKEYWNDVFSDLIKDYQNGLTPNPDILCNKKIKFNQFYNYAINRLECDLISTGHYAQNSFGEWLQYYNPQGAHLMKAVDDRKDQTFFLSQIPQTALQKTLFPLGKFKKCEVKKIAFENNFDKIAKKKESMGICFIGSRHFQSFINEYIKPEEGDFIDFDSGEVVGKHLGKHNWTLGQRCNIPGVKLPYYVALKTNSQKIYVVSGHNHPLLYSTMFTTHSSYWIHSEPKELAERKLFECKFRFQHGKPLTSCRIMSLGDGKLHVMLDKPLRALTPGQYAVFYKGPNCLGSSRIDYVGPTEFSLGHKIPNDNQQNSSL